jgi:uncharacterized protein (DUF486 family)
MWVLPYIVPIVFLVISNVFMTLAWYGHLKFPQMTLWIAVLVSWSLAFFEYWLAVPANRIGYQVFSIAELKTIQVVVALSVFTAIAVLVFDQKFTLQHIFGFCLIALGAGFVFSANKGL